MIIAQSPGSAGIEPWKIQAAQDGGLHNVDSLATACSTTEVPFAVGCALIEKESLGLNVWGRADASPFAGYTRSVSQESFLLFHFLVTQRGLVPTGVGPCQITYAGTLSKDGRRDGGYFRMMLAEDLRPWVPVDNMIFGLRLLRANYDRLGSWEKAGAVYNGGPRPGASALAYGRDLVAKTAAWRERFKAARP